MDWHSVMVVVGKSLSHAWGYLEVCLSVVTTCVLLTHREYGGRWVGARHHC